MWHYVKNNEVQGPVADDEALRRLAAGTIQPDTLVWQEGMTDWQPARTCPFFRSREAGAPPPLTPPRAPSATTNNDNDVTLGVLAHVLGLLTGFIGPLIILLAAPQAIAKQHARDALNWQLSFLIYFIGSMLLALILVGFVLMFALFILDVVFCIVAAVKAGQGQGWSYPLAIPFVRG